MISEYLSDNNKIDFITECLEANEYKQDKPKILFSSIIITLTINSLIALFDPKALIEYPYISVALFLIIAMGLSLISDTGIAPSTVITRYLVKVSNNSLIVRMFSIVNIESNFIYPLREIGGIGLSEKTEKIKCGRIKTRLKGRVIEIYNLRGRKVFEFGFWLHPDDCVKLYDELASVLSIKRRSSRRNFN